MAKQSEGTLEVLVADQDDATTLPLLEALRVLAFQARRARTVTELVLALGQARNVLLFIDEDFDPRRGLDLVEHLSEKAEDEGRRLTVFVLSSAHDPMKALAATRAGASSYVAKPLRPALLTQILTEARAMALNSSNRGSRSTTSPDDTLESTATPSFTATSPLPSEIDPSARPPVGTEAEQAAENDPLLEVLAPLRRYPMNRMSVLGEVPAEPGVILFYDEDERPLFLEYAANLSDRLGYYVDLHAALSELSRRARFFEVFPTDDPLLIGKFFDRLVNKHGRFPLMMTEAPEGSRQHPKGDAIHEREVARSHAAADSRKAAASVTHYAKPAPGTVEDLKKMMALNPTDPDIQDWLAFSLYSNHLYAESVRWYSRLIKDGSRKEEHFFYCGNAFFRIGDLDHARRMWEIASKLHPDSQIGRKSRERLVGLQRRPPADERH